MIDETEVNTQITDTVQEAQLEPQPAPKPESPAEINLRALANAKLKVEKERDEALRYARELEQRYAPKPVAEEDNEIKLGDDELAEGKHLSKMGRKVKRLEEELNQYKKQSYEQTAEMKLKAQFPDFDKVVNSDTVRALQEQEPELYDTIKSSPDLYKQAVAAYKMIKKNGIYQDTTYDAEKEIAQRNANKPRPLASVSPQQGDSPLSHANAFANGLTDSLKDQLRKEMFEAMKNR